MYWIEAVISTTSEGIEPVAGRLLMNGITGYVVEDSAEFCEFLEGEGVFFDYVEDDLLKLKDCETTVKFYVAENTQGFEILVAVKKSLDELKLIDKDGIFGELSLTTNSKIQDCLFNLE